jgi:hypothetical protein
MTESFALHFPNRKQFLAAIRQRPKKFIGLIAKRWRSAGNELVREIVREQLSGRRGNKGLNRTTGNASRALNIKTEKLVDDVVQTLFLSKTNPAKDYLPMHDASRKGDGIIKAKSKPYLHFPIKGVRTHGKGGKRLKRARKETQGWVKVKQVKIPVRTNIIETYMKKTRPKLYSAFRDAAREAHALG